ncbi:MAG: PAS domain-containing protein [Alphaproteobacteria bacterium]|nr:PAS domain-containing protein [Alphaproteobacteria bacterium]
MPIHLKFEISNFRIGTPGEFRILNGRSTMEDQELTATRELEPPPEQTRAQDQEQERRLVLRVLRRWEELRGVRSFPVREEILPDTMGDDWRCCFLLDLDGTGGAEFLHVGDALEASAWNPPVRKLSECPDGTLLKMATAFHPRIIDKRIPISIGASGQHNGRAILFRAIMLPLSHDSVRIDGLLGAANFRETVGDKT